LTEKIIEGEKEEGGPDRYSSLYFFSGLAMRRRKKTLREEREGEGK